MSGFDSYSDYDALGLAALVQAREVTSLELVETCIARIEQLNPKVNAVVQTMYDAARARAASVVSDDPGAPFAGVPFLLKDLLQTIPGVPTNSGSRFWQGHTVDHEGTLFRRFQEAGLVTVAKTNTPELGLMPVSEPELFGPTRNPWDLNRTAGGSSGGSAAAVAAGIVPMASGGDGGGSIRIPAACCGLFGLKPTRGRTPAGPDASEHWNGFALEHVITRSVRDSAAMLDATHGPEPFAPYHAPHFDGSWLEELEKPPKGGRPLRVAFHVEPAFHAQVHADCDAGVRDVAKLLESLGHEVSEVRPGHDVERISMAFFTVIGGNTAAGLVQAERTRGRKPGPNDFETGTQLAALLGRIFTAGDFALAIMDLQDESRRLQELYADYDVVLSPTLAQPPVEVGSMFKTGFEATLERFIARRGIKSALRLPGIIDKAVKEIFSFSPFTPVQNFTGQPSMSVPLHFSAAGLPIGTMFTGRFGDEQTLFQLARQLEQERPWAQRRPPVFAS
ncbi:MAG: amidase [Myxococcales bacterium]|nr:amidase [Myxococcales bacterium]MCB9629183.1 amidase [Sandaracinaceae bacterium]